MGDWATYRAWNEAVAEVVFPELPEPAPVYLDLEEDVLAEIARVAGYVGEPREGLKAAVQGVTVWRSMFSLDELWGKQRSWRRRRDTVPPALAFLALAALAAEDMGSSTDGFDQADYYSRLCVLVGLSPTDQATRQHYMRRAESLWADLNSWLESHDGLRGSPTAYALSYRYVGLPLSQALVRSRDRQKFPHFFMQYGLAAGMELAPEVLQRYLDSWFGHEGCPASAALKKLWSRPSARERIAMVAAVELVGWDGAVGHVEHGQPAPAFQRVSLMAQVRQGFMGSTLDVALTVRSMREGEFDGRMEVKAAGGQWLPLSLTPVLANVWRTGTSAGLDVGSVLEGVVVLRPAGQESMAFRHHPRSIVPLVFDEMQAAFTEQERMQLGVDSLLLVRGEARGRPLASEVVALLRTCARPGFQVHDQLAGLPAGWVLITDLQLFGAPASAQYNELVPLARDQLTIAGGMRIPSRIRKWSSVAPPEIRASVESVPNLRLVLVDLATEQEMVWTSDGGALVVPLQPLELPAGDYRAALFAGTARNPLQQSTIRLRSADQVDRGWHLRAFLGYDLSTPTGALTATGMGTSDLPVRQVRGAAATGASGVDPSVEAVSKPVWASPKPQAPPSMPVSIGTPEPNSCVATGAHHTEYPTFYGGWQPQYIEGTCKYCGLVKRSPGWARRRKGPAHQSAQAAQVEVAALPQVDGSRSRLWDAAVDALRHVGGGGGSSMSSVAAQIDGSALFAAAFPTSLEQLGHVSVVRRANGTVAEWEISPTQLIAVPDGLELVGFWPEVLVWRIAELLQPAGGELFEQESTDQPTRRWFEGLSVERATEVIAEQPVEVIPSPASGVLRALPRLSDVSLDLTREPMPGFEKAEAYDVSSSTWVLTTDVAHAGSFRLTRGFERIYLFRSTADIADRSCARGAASLVKHLAANGLGQSLASYLDRDSLVIVPRGGDLPGLYGRAAVLCSGSLPAESTVISNGNRRACLTYQHIDPVTANLLVTLLST